MTHAHWKPGQKYQIGRCPGCGSWLTWWLDLAKDETPIVIWADCPTCIALAARHDPKENPAP